jgi:hypothetical protein
VGGKELTQILKSSCARRISPFLSELEKKFNI